MKNRKDSPKEILFSPFEVILIDPNWLFGPQSQTIETFPPKKAGLDPHELVFFQIEMVEVVVLGFARSFEEQDLYNEEVYDPSRIVYLIKIAYDFKTFRSKSKGLIQAKNVFPYDESGVVVLHLEENTYYEALRNKCFVKREKLLSVEEALTHESFFVRKYAKKISTSS